MKFNFIKPFIKEFLILNFLTIVCLWGLNKYGYIIISYRENWVFVSAIIVIILYFINASPSSATIGFRSAIDYITKKKNVAEGQFVQCVKRQHSCVLDKRTRNFKVIHQYYYDV